MDTFDFGNALKVLKRGEMIARVGWNAHHTLNLQIPDEHSKMTRPYIYMIIGTDAVDMKGDQLPWVASQTDLLAEDWIQISH